MQTPLGKREALRRPRNLGSGQAAPRMRHLSLLSRSFRPSRSGAGEAGGPERAKSCQAAGCGEGGGLSRACRHLSSGAEGRKPAILTEPVPPEPRGKTVGVNYVSAFFNPCLVPAAPRGRLSRAHAETGKPAPGPAWRALGVDADAPREGLCVPLRASGSCRKPARRAAEWRCHQPVVRELGGFLDEEVIPDLPQRPGVPRLHPALASSPAATSGQATEAAPPD